MALAYVQGKMGQANGVTSVAITFNTTPGAGSLIVAGFYAVASGSPTFAATCADNKGNTYTDADQFTSGAGGDRVGIGGFYAMNVSSSATFTVTISNLPSGAVTAFIAEVSGAHLTAALDVAIAQDEASTLNPTTASTGVLAQAAEIVFALTGTYPSFQSGGIMTCNTSGYTQIFEHVAPNTNTYGVGEADYRIVAATTAQQVDWTTDYSSNDFGTLIMAFKEAAGGAASPTGNTLYSKVLRSLTQGRVIG